MSARSLVFGLVLCAVAVYGQDLPSPSGRIARPAPFLEHSRLNSNGFPPVRALGSGTDTVRVLALMVDFQSAANPLTTGNGKFQLGATSQAMIDPPPHDSAYFAGKLQFLSNYFRKVSGGKLIVRGELFGRVVTLSKPMASYSPAKDGSNDLPLANLVIESWRTVDSLYPAIQFGNYQAFLIFHAGVGRDLDLVSALGYDPAPFDIPSLTFNLKTLRNYLGDQSYAGVRVDGGAFRITNTMVLPETETRTIGTSSVPDTLYGSINGLLANSFGSYLGLPDLFNTRTGRSGIGNFGLMDVAGSISFFAGAFPPEPSAWEKIALGWVSPITVNPGTTTLTLPAVGLKNGRDTVYKIPISDREYFLVENRSRDPHGNGQRITIQRGGSIATMTFPTDTPGFNLDEVRLINGSVIDVEDFDWALPGLTSAGNDYVGGGVLIWHIDEDVIERGIVDNSINADPSHPGIYLKEADGSRDIGRTYDPFSEPGAGKELGWPLDFWFQGNASKVYTNVFDGSTHPDSRSHSGALSLVTIRGFSNRSPRMSATVEIGDSQIRRIPTFSRKLPVTGAVTQVSVTSKTVLTGVDGKIYAFRPDGSSRAKDSTGLITERGGAFSLAAMDNGADLLVAGVHDSTLHILNAIDNNADGVFDQVQSTAISLGENASTPAMFADLSIAPSIVVGTSRGVILSFSMLGVLQKKTVVSSRPVSSMCLLPTASLSKPQELFFTSGGRLYTEESSVSLGDSSLPWLLVGAPSRSGNFVVAAQSGGSQVLAYSRDLTTKLFDRSFNTPGFSSMIAADIDGDGEKDIILVSGERIYAVNRTGAVLSGFPVTAPNRDMFSASTVVGDVTGDGLPELLACTHSGSLIAYDKNGNQLKGFPVQLASGGETSLALFQTLSSTIGFVGATASGSLHALELNKPYVASNIVWSQYLGDARHSNADHTIVGTMPVSPSFLPASRVYNWPNPVYGSSTQIRFQTSEDAAITISIFDLSGLKITELKTLSKGGMDGEISWDVSKIQSGVYLAHVEASGNSRNESVIVKIAVVK